MSYNSNSEITRLRWLDIAKGIAIICTIIGHTVPYGCKIRNLIFSFHMPLFFLLAGYTMKEVPPDRLLEATWKDIKRLILPVFFMRGITFMVQVMIEKTAVQIALWDNIRRIFWGSGDYSLLLFSVPLQMYSVGVVWFLLALFWSKLAYRLLAIFFKEYRLIFLLLISFAGMEIGSRLRLPQCMDMIPLILFFMEVGWNLREKKVVDSNRWLGGGILACLLWLYLTGDRGIYIEMATREYPYSVVCVLIAVMASVVIIQFAQSLEPFVIITPVAVIGIHSLELLCIHYLDRYFKFIWDAALFPQAGKLELINKVIAAVARVFFDILILFLWIALKKGYQSVRYMSRKRLKDMPK